MKVAVTGGSGRIGQELCRQLVARGHPVFNLDRKAFREPGVKFCYVDLTQRAQVQPILEQCEAVCHLGEFPGLMGPLPAEMVYVHNTTAGSTVMQTAGDLGLKRLIYTSSCQVYGCFGHPLVAPLRFPLDETHPFQPQQAYAASKVANEAYAQSVAARTGIPVSIFRFPAVWPLPKDKLDELLPRYFNWSRNGQDLCTYVSCADAARAYLLALESSRPGCEAYHFTAPEILSDVPLSAVVAKVLPATPALPPDWPPFRSPLLTAKAREHLGWEAQDNMLDAFRRKLHEER